MTTLVKITGGKIADAYAAQNDIVIGKAYVVHDSSNGRYFNCECGEKFYFESPWIGAELGVFDVTNDFQYTVFTGQVVLDATSPTFEKDFAEYEKLGFRTVQKFVLEFQGE